MKKPSTAAPKELVSNCFTAMPFFSRILPALIIFVAIIFLLLVNEMSAKVSKETDSPNVFCGKIVES